MREAGLIGAVTVLVAFAVLFVYPRLSIHKIDLRVYFQNANGLRVGAPVRLAGVDVGTITSVRARPEMQPAAAEVTLGLRTPYELNIPNDATVSLATAGVLGETLAEINTAGASGPPAKNGETLKEKPTKVLSSEDLIEKLGDIIQRKPCGPQGKDVAAAGTSDNDEKTIPKPSSR